MAWLAIISPSVAPKRPVPCVSARVIVICAMPYMPATWQRRYAVGEPQEEGCRDEGSRDAPAPTPSMIWVAMRAYGLGHA